MVEDANKPGMLEAVEKLGKDSAFRKAVIADADNALKVYALEPKQKAALAEMAKGFAEDKKESVAAAGKAATKWYVPGSFKDLIAAVLSVVLMVLLLIAVAQTYRLISAPPAAVEVGDTMVQWSSYDRASTFFSTLFPLFSAVVTFYLGAAIESKRGDEAAERAEQAQGKAEDADRRAGDAEQEARAEKDKREGLVAEVSAELDRAGAKGGRLEATAAPHAADTIDRLKEILQKY